MKKFPGTIFLALLLASTASRALETGPSAAGAPDDSPARKCWVNVADRLSAGGTTSMLTAVPPGLRCISMATQRSRARLSPAVVPPLAASDPRLQNPGNLLAQNQTQQSPQAKPPATPQSPAEQQHEIQGMEGMEMHSPQDITSNVSGVQEPENPNRKTGSNIPVPDLLHAARQAPAKKLEEFEALALKNNPTLKQAEANVRISAGMARQAGLWPNPSAGYDADEIRGGSFSGGEQGAFVQQDIVLGGKLRMRRNVFEQQQRANVIAVEEQKLSVRGAVQTRFYTALAQLRVVDVERDLMGIAMDAAATAHQLANVGQADAPDVLQAEVEAEQVKLAFVRAQRAYIVAFQRLALVAGDTRMPLSLLEGDLGEPPEIDPDKYLEDLMAHSPTLKRAQQQVTRAEAELAESRRDVIPDLTLKAGIHQNREINDLSLRRVGLEGFAGVGIQLPIFNRNQGNIEASRASVERSREEVQRIKLELSETAQALLQKYLSSKEDVERYNTQLIPRARRAYQLYVQKYQNMAAAYPEVIVSQRTLSQLEESYAHSLSDLWSAAIQLQNYLLVDGLESAAEAARGVNTAGTSGSRASGTE